MRHKSCFTLKGLMAVLIKYFQPASYKIIPGVIILFLMPRIVLSQGNINRSFSEVFTIISDSVVNRDSVVQTKSVVFPIKPEAKKNTELFYDTLKNRAQKNYLLRTIHDFLIIQPEEARMLKSDRIDNIQNPFTKFKGKKIENIVIKRLNVFGTSFEDSVISDISWYKDFGNWMHISTKEYIIRENLLFHEGDTLDPLLLIDNERLLRRLRYIKDARVLVLPDKEDSESVDVMIVTQDVWSKGFNMDVESINRGAVTLYDNNIFGIGHELEGGMLYDYLGAENFGFNTSYRINNLLGSFINGRAFYLDAFEDRRFGIKLSRGFYSYKTNWVGGVAASKNETRRNIQKEDTLLTNVDLDYINQDLWLGYGIPLKSETKLFRQRNRLVLSARYMRSKFYDGPIVKERYNYKYHDHHTFLANISFSRQNFYESSLIYNFGPTEDIPVGDLFGYTFGWEADEFFKRFYSGINLKHGEYIQNFGYLSNSLNFGGFIYENTFEQGVLDFKSNYISKLFQVKNLKLRQFVNINYKYGINRFQDENISFNRIYDIRGFDDDGLFGDKKLVVKLETVGFTNMFYYGFRFAIYGFWDMGFVGPESRVIFNNPMQHGFGIGLRVRNENLVFQTFQMRLGFYPTLSPQNNLLFRITGEKTLVPDRYTPSAPSVVAF